MLFSIDKIRKMWYGNRSSFSMTMTVFFSDDDPALAGLQEEFEAAFDADFRAHEREFEETFQAHCKEAEDKHFQAHYEESFRAHCEAALKAKPNNPLLREAIEIGLSLL